MTVRDALREGAAALSGTETAFLDASLLLADALGADRAGLLARAPDEVAEDAFLRFRSHLALRARGRPVAYILGYKEFWGRVFAVDERVLIPRPDTETLVEVALKLGDAILEEEAGDPLFRLRVHEACTGSGCVAISLAADRPAWSVSASDLSEGALEVAADNAAALLGPSGGGGSRPGGELAFSSGDLLEGASGPFDLIVANPPYVGSSETDELLGKGWSEPRMALDGGADGLDAIRRLVPEAADCLAPGGALLVEADGAQAEAVAELFRASRFIGIETLRDLGGRPRVTSGRKPWTT